MTSSGDRLAVCTSGQSAVSPRISTGSLPANRSSNGMRSNLSPSMTRTWCVMASGRLQPGDLEIDQFLEIAQRRNQEVHQAQKAEPVQFEQLLRIERGEFFLVDGVVTAEVVAQLREHG